MLPEPRLELVNPALLSLLCCPVCHADLTLEGRFLRCAPCAREYPIVLGIPDLRLYEDPLIPLEDDYRKGEKVQVQAEQLSFADLVRYYWSLPTYPYTPPELSARFIHHVLTDEGRVKGYLDQLGSGGAFLEVGCGTAAAVRMAAPRFELAVGTDVAFRWLLIARRRLQEAGLPTNLVCCCADHLPFKPGQFQSVASVALLEHVADQPRAVAEFARVTSTGGSVFTWTTNRFSIAREPHVQVWGVGFLPRRWMAAYVRWASGLAYEKKRLLSMFELGRYLRQAGFRRAEYSLPPISPADWADLSGPARWGARLFLALGKVPGLGWLLKVISPVIVCRAERGEDGRR